MKKDNEIYSMIIDNLSINTKKQMNITIDSEIFEKFDSLTKKKKLKKSAVIEQLIKLFVEQQQ